MAEPSTLQPGRHRAAVHSCTAAGSRPASSPGRPTRTGARHVGQAARRSREGHRPREVHVRHQSSRHALRAHRPLAASARAGRLGRSVGGEARAGRQGRARVEGSGERTEQPRDVPGRRGRGRRRRHRGARDRRRAAGQGRVRGAAARDRRRAGARREGAGGLHRRQRASGADPGDRRSRGGVQGGGAHHRGDLRDARHHARLPRVARHGVRVGRRQADGLDLDAGHQRRARELRDRARASAGQRPRHLPVHGRRLRQQGAERRRRGPDLRQAREGGERAGQADARSQGGASRDRQSAVGGSARQGRRLGRRHHHGVRRRVVGARAAPARRPGSRCRTSIGSRTAAGRTRTCSPTRASSGRCARRDIRRARSSPRS